MGSKKQRFNTGTTAMLHISETEWVKIKALPLTVADQKKVEAAGIKPHSVDGRVFNLVDWATHDIIRAEIFIIDWNLTDADDKGVDYSPDALRALDDDSFEEVNNALLKYIKEYSESKKSLGATTPVPTTDSSSKATS